MLANVNDYLPIGSIVQLKGGNKKIMIFGIVQHDTVSERSVEYDYVAVPYPEGNMGPGFQYLFNKNDIESVVARGFENEEREVFLKNLDSLR